MNQRRVTFADAQQGSRSDHRQGHMNNRPRGPQSSPSVNMLETVTPPDSAGEEDTPSSDAYTPIDSDEEEPDRHEECSLINNPTYFHIDGRICDYDVTFLVDTGSTIDCLSYKTYKKLKNPPKLVKQKEAIRGVNGTECKCYGTFPAIIQIQHKWK